MKLLNAAVVAACFVAGASRLNAASTNIVQAIHFQLTAYEQGVTNHPNTNLTVVTVNKLRITTKDVIAAIGNATAQNFSPLARLVHVITINANTNIEAIEIRDGTNRLDVTSYFDGTGRSNSIRSSMYNSKTKIGSGTTYSLFHLMINLPPASLVADGFATTTHTAIITRGLVSGVDEVNATVAGTGTDLHGVPFTANGNVSILGRTVEVR